MAIRRRITTTTIDEFDNSPTRIPGDKNHNIVSDEEKQTDINQDSYDDGDQEEFKASNSSHIFKTTVGRTFFDLIFEFKNDPRWMTIFIVGLVFFTYTMKLSNINDFDFKYPSIIAGVLLLFWFVGAAIIEIGKRRQK